MRPVTTFLSDIMQEFRINAAALSRITGLHQSDISRIRSGQLKLSKPQTHAIAARLWTYGVEQGMARELLQRLLHGFVLSHGYLPLTLCPSGLHAVRFLSCLNHAQQKEALDFLARWLEAQKEFQPIVRSVYERHEFEADDEEEELDDEED